MKDLSHPELHNACQSAVVEVLELMFFELPIAAAQLSSSFQPDPIAARARFDGSLRGALTLAVSTASCTRLAASLLGIEPDEIDDLNRLSTVTELANMLCGATMSRLEPEGRLHIEQPLSIPAAEAPAGPWLVFPLEDGLLSVFIQFQEQ
ncbi:MAG: chemotaxis protein CheX [Candidatus Solibacter usitatus]|nr:chemotaxis protein CheX [Candidatus Solibacter usitatus]